MMLHEDRYAFLALLNQIHEASGIRLDILEKDLILRNCLLLYSIVKNP